MYRTDIYFLSKTLAEVILLNLQLFNGYYKYSTYSLSEFTQNN